MSAMKAYLMSEANVADAELELELAEGRWAATTLACALAAPRVDAATLDELTFEAARDLGEAHERVAVALGYDGAWDRLGAR